VPFVPVPAITLLSDPEQVSFHQFFVHVHGKGRYQFPLAGLPADALHWMAFSPQKEHVAYPRFNP
jgi:hypothetical protein